MDIPERIIVEVVSSSDVKRLEGRDEDIRKEIQELARRVDGLHRTLYELLSTLSKN